MLTVIIPMIIGFLLFAIHDFRRKLPAKLFISAGLLGAVFGGGTGIFLLALLTATAPREIYLEKEHRLLTDAEISVAEINVNRSKTYHYFAYENKESGKIIFNNPNDDNNISVSEEEDRKNGVVEIYASRVPRDKWYSWFTASDKKPHSQKIRVPENGINRIILK